MESYYRCPQEYYLRYELGLPSNELLREHTEKLPANIFGSIVHNILEKYRPDKKKSLPAMIRTACIANGVIPDAKIIKAVRRRIEEVDDLPLAEGTREVRFDWRCGGTTITGAIDWLKPKGEGYEIVDFKTDRIEHYEVPTRAKEYDLQLICYALATEAATNRPVESTTLHFLVPGETHSIPVTDDRRDDGRKLISEIIDSIAQKNFELGGEKRPCFKCPYRHNGMCWQGKAE